MNKLTFKLISVLLALIMSVTVVFASSYAWLVLSKNPAATGIQVAIGGGNTILVAPNVREVMADGTVCNYPGPFSDKMDFGQQKAYSYLKTIGKLNPVSTANGVDWILPVYYSGADPEVQNGLIPSGTIKNTSEFRVDSELSYANIPADQAAKIHEGHYVYLDFWVASPGGDYKLRVSTGVEEPEGGSFAINLLEPVETDTGFALAEPEGGISAAVRVGFLANDLLLVDDELSLYSQTSHYDARFTRLKGMYQEPNTGTVYMDQNRFTIYEPNGDYHPEEPSIEGCYVETRPLGLVEGRIIPRIIKNNLTVQKKTSWAKLDANSNTTRLEQYFQTALYAQAGKDLSEDEVSALFYDAYLQGQISPYVQKGGFVDYTGNLYTQLSLNDGVVPADYLENQNNGATNDVYIIELERNVPQRIRMFIWLEGQDVDCVNSISMSRFALNIELASGDE